MQSIHTPGAMITTVLSTVVLLLFACGPGGPNDHVQPSTITHGASPQKEGIGLGQSSSVTSSPAPAENLAVPKWMTQALASPDIWVRLNALETWVRRNERSVVNPLIPALDDPNELVRNRAMQLIEEDWIAEQVILSK